MPAAEVSIPSVLLVVIPPSQEFPAHRPGPGRRGRSALCVYCSHKAEPEHGTCPLSPCHKQSSQGRAAWPGLHHPLLRNRVLEWDELPYSLGALGPGQLTVWGKVSASRCKIFPVAWSTHWLQDMLLPGVYCLALRAPFPQGHLSQQLGATKRHGS